MAASHFDRLRAFARAKGVHIRRGSTYACWDRVERIIHIPLRLRGRDATYTLLHELGHVLVDASGRFDLNVYIHEHARSWEGRALCVAEEWAAWERGKKLAGALGIPISSEGYDRFAAAHVASYVHAAGSTPF